MKLNFFHKKEEPQDLTEGDDGAVFFGSMGTEEDLPRPIGLSKEEWTPALKEHIKGLKKSRPKLYDKILNGH